MEFPQSESSDCLLIKGELNAPRGSGSTLNIVISLADTRGRLFSSRSLVFSCSDAWSPLHLSVWLISQDIHLEMAAIHQGDPGRATRSLPCLLLNQSLLLFSILKVFLLPYSIAFFFFGFFLLISILPLAPFLCLAEKPPRTCQLLKPFGCILCLPPSPCFVGVKQRTPCYLWVNWQPWRDASPQAFTA